MAPPATNPRVVRFGVFELDLEARQLRKSGVRIKLHEQPFQVLAMLVERPGTVVTREELQKRLWPTDTFVDFDLSLNSAVKKLRQALGDDSENPRFVETLYRRGYRFIGPVAAMAGSNGGRLELLDNPGATTPSHPSPIETIPPLWISGRRSLLHWVFGVTMLLLMTAGVVAYQLIPPQPPRVLGFTQITHDGLFKTNVFSDGERLYFMELQGDHFVVNQVSVAGGETSSVPTPFANVEIDGLAPNGSALVVNSFKGTGAAEETWSLPLPSGPPRLLNDLHTNSVAWSPDGTQLLYSGGQEIYAANNDLSNSRKLATLAGRVRMLRLSPDGREIRFDVSDAADDRSSIWEMAGDGSGLRPLLPSWNSVPDECCGNWTPDGKYFVFQSFREGRNSLWALAEKSSWLSRTPPKPVQLTNGPLEFGSPVVSKDGKRIFAIGMQPHCELVHYDGKSGFEPYLDGNSIRDLAFSPDGKWTAYVTVPQGELWRSRVNGSERLQLTPEGMEGALPRWSPDGKQIVFMGTSFKTDWIAYLISSDGTGLRELIPGAKSGYDPGWSPDGKSIVLTLGAGGSPGLNPEGIIIYDLEAKKSSFLPGTSGLFSPRWSPDGRYIAAVTNDSLKLMLFNLSSRQWQELANSPIGYPSWSHDGQYIYFDTALNEDAAFFRVRISDHKVERLFSLKGLRRYWGPFGPWTGLAPDDSPLLARDISSQEIYALDWQVP